MLFVTQGEWCVIERCLGVSGGLGPREELVLEKPKVFLSCGLLPSNVQCGGRAVSCNDPRVAALGYSRRSAPVRGAEG